MILLGVPARGKRQRLEMLDSELHVGAPCSYAPKLAASLPLEAAVVRGACSYIDWKDNM